MNTNDSNLKKRTNQALPEIKRERLPGTKVDMFKIKDEKGKEHDAREETFAEKEIESVHLTKIAPMFYFCKDNNKILMIPFTMQFTTYEFLQLAAKMSGSLQDILNQAEPKDKVADPKDKNEGDKT